MLASLDLRAWAGRAALAIVRHPRGLWADVRGRRLVITTLGNSTDLTSLRTVVYPLPQLEPGGLDEVTWHEVIRENVDPGTWDNVGGPGHIEPVPGALVIVQTSDAHRRIRQIIGALAQIVPERFPVPTQVHKGLKARLFNTLFVDGFNALPRAWVRRYGHHLMAFATKGGGRPDGTESRR